ncbi:TPA: pentapeptide repeat-containing protein [Pseudomonas aeruginosa]|nr:pentapeptide repeat-containing protein [Pseudomonas aeruginosa]
MKTYTKEALAEIIEKHRMWLDDEEGGERANLSYACLSGAYLSYADLSGAYLGSANLSGANLSGAYLSYADLRGAYLSGAYLSYADLSGAYLSYADLRGANLSGAYLSYADLRGANLRGANLSGANLSEANLSEANLSEANLSELSSMNGLTGNLREVKAVQADTWPVTYTATHMQIGCQLHLISEWWSFNDEEISGMAPKAMAWWAIWKPILRQIIEVSPAVPGSESPAETEAE